MTVYGRERQIGALAPVRGELLAVRPAWMTAEQYGPVSILAIWEAAYEEPIYLVTNMVDLEAAIALYRKRAHVETFFSDQKSRGFHLGHSHICDPKRVSRLLIASCLAYIWIVYLGALVHNDTKKMRQVHRRDRCDLSLFQLGLAWLEECLTIAQQAP